MIINAFLRTRSAHRSAATAGGTAGTARARPVQAAGTSARARILVLFTLFFFLRDGGQIWQFLCHMLPRPAQVPVARAGHYSWFTLVSYVRATVLVAFVDAVGIGIGLAVLRVPLALPLAALVFLGAFIP
jgi:predicted PurR-regulated permease PerM